jgi:cytochrome c oxidase cbb3-type subunit III
MRAVAAFIALMTLPCSTFGQVAPDSNNPFQGSAEAAAAGKGLFGKMNCAGCHGYDLTGRMGPDLTGNSWLYGGKPGEIFHTISEGTPRGMPSWKSQLTTEQIWQLVTYIQSRHAK